MDNHLKLGLIGIGSMGRHFADRFLAHGYEIIIHDVNEQALEQFRGKNGVSFGSAPVDVANQSEVVFVSLPTPQIVREVALGVKGLIHGTKIKTYIDLSTTGQKIAEEVGIQLSERGIEVLDSPVSGGVPGARQGTLAIMVSGNRETFERIQPLLNVIGSKIFYIGEQVGQGQVMKLTNNLLSATAMAITSEAVVLGAKAGIDPQTMIAVINSGTGRNSASLDKFPKVVLNRKFDYGFKTHLMYKDLRLCMELAEESCVPLWLGANVKQIWGYVMSQGGADKDFTSILEYIEQLANVTVPTVEVNLDETQ